MNQRENNVEEKEPKLEVSDALSIRFGDVVVTISAEEGGVLEGRTNEQIVKYCADLLLQTTDASSLENFLDTTMAIEETLREDFEMNSLQVSTFLAKWRKRLYLKTIGEENPVVEEFKPIRAVEPSSDDEIADTRVEVVQEGENVVVKNVPKEKQKRPLQGAQMSPISLPLHDKKIISTDPNLPSPNTFTVVENEDKK